MRFEDKKLKTQRRKGSWVVGLICGPAFALLFCLIFFIPPLISNLTLNPLLCIIGAIAATAPLADRIGKRRKVTAEQFAGPVALCCMLFLGLFVFLAFSLSIASKY
ncbi:hypothetical protein P4B35_04170 [Pontiellaceae bacterium B12227]|nr:hypothetical protein [Pontiellaceae bacterium B12227]